MSTTLSLQNGIAQFIGPEQVFGRSEIRGAFQTGAGAGYSELVVSRISGFPTPLEDAGFIMSLATDL